MPPVKEPSDLLPETNQFNNQLKNELIEFANMVSEEFSGENHKQDHNMAKNEVKNSILIEQNSNNQFSSSVNNYLSPINPIDIESEDENIETQNKTTDFLSYDEEFHLPEVDWVGLEAKLKEAQHEIEMQVNKIK